MPPTRRTALATLPANVPIAAAAAAGPADKAVPEKKMAEKVPEKAARTRGKSAAAAEAVAAGGGGSAAAGSSGGTGAVTVKVEEPPKMFTLRAAVPREAKKRADDAAAEEMSTRFHQLLQPIRDLAQNWDIDVATELEEYLHEVEQITFSFENGPKDLNFAQAALLIQGSASVYSRKVEYLYGLVFQTLELVNDKKRKVRSSLDDEGRDTDVSLQQAEDEFLSLDDITAATNIDLAEGVDGHGSRRASSRNNALLLRTPAALMPQLDRGVGADLVSTRGDVVGKRDDFKMNTSMMHSSGALVLDITDLRLMDRDRATAAAASSGQDDYVGGGGYDSPPRANADQDDDDDDNMGADHGGAAMQTDARGPLPGNDATGRWSLGSGIIVDSDMGRMSTGLNESLTDYVDPWAMLDPHAATASLARPFRKGTPYRIPALPTPSEQSLPMPMLPLTQFLNDIAAGRSAAKRAVVKVASKSTTFPELEGVYQREKERRQKATAALDRRARMLSTTFSRRGGSNPWDLAAMAAATRPGGLSAGAGADPLGGDDSDDDMGGLGGGGYDEHDAGPAPTSAPSVDMDQHDKGGYDNDDDDNLPMGGSDVWSGSARAAAAAAAAAQEADQQPSTHVSSYEELCRLRIDSYLASAHRYEQQLETSLTRRVKEWEDRLTPLLTEQESRVAFDVHRYSGQVLETFVDRGLVAGKSLMLEDVAGPSAPVFEVIRLFMASLHLANSGNVNIAVDHGHMELQLRSSVLRELAV